MKRFLLILLAVISLSPVLLSQTINYSSVKVKTKTEKEKRVYTFPYEQFIMLNYGAVGGSRVRGNSLGLQYGQVHIGGWYVSADVSLSLLHFANTATANYGRSSTDMVNYAGYNVCPHFIAGKTSFNRICVGGGGIVRLVIPLYFYLGMGYLYQTVTAETKEFGWVEMRYYNGNVKYNDRYSPHSSGYFELGLQGNIKGFTMRLGYRYGFCQTNELSVGLGVTLGRESKKSNPKTDE